MWADWIPGILMLVLFALETPIAFAIAIAALSFFLIDGGCRSTSSCRRW